MIQPLSRFVRDCYYISKAPSGSKATILWNLLFPGENRMGFKIAHFDSWNLNYLYRELFVRQYYYFRTENDSPTILDCGANIGMASIYFQWLYPKSRIQAFEPDPRTFLLLERNIAQNRLNVKPYNCALWNEDAELDFFVDLSKPGSLAMSTNPSRLDGKCIRVAARKLSDFIHSSVDFMKLDVEGAESQVIHDLVKTGKISLIKRMVIEYHHRIGSEASCFAEFLLALEQSGFQYQIDASVHPVTSRDVFQNIAIGAYR